MEEKAQLNESTVSLGMKAKSGDEWWRRRMRPGIEPEDEEDEEKDEEKDEDEVGD